MVAEGIDDEQIAAALGRTPKAVRTKIYLVRRSQPGRAEQTRKARSRRTSGASFFLS
jgi:hypothetical protein